MVDIVIDGVTTLELVGIGCTVSEHHRLCLTLLVKDDCSVSVSYDRSVRTCRTGNLLFNGSTLLVKDVITLVIGLIATPVTVLVNALVLESVD